MTERFTEKDLERAAAQFLEANLTDGRIECNICHKTYVHPKTANKHVQERHLNDVMKKAEDIEREFEKRRAEWEKKRAIELGNEYFASLESSIKYLLREVQRDKRAYEKARDQEPYENGYLPPISNMTQEIQACIYHVVNNFNHDVSLGVRAVASLTKVFNFDI